MMLRSILLKTLRDQRRALVGWSIGVGLFCLMMVAYFPTIEQMGDDFQKLIESYPPAMQAFFGDFSDLTTGPGYLRAELFSLMFPILFLIYAVGRGADLVAGEEERGALDVLLAHPVDRRRVVLEKAGGLALGILALSLVAWAVLAAGDLALGMDVGAVRIGVAMLALALLAMAFGGLALAVGGLRGRKGPAVAAAASLAVAMYLVTSIGRLVDGLSAVQPLSLYHHYERAHGLGGAVDGVGFVALALSAAATVGLAAWGFERRDVGV